VNPTPLPLAVVAFDRVVPFDLAIPTDVFDHVLLADGSHAYDVRVCASTREVSAGRFHVRVQHGLDALAHAHTIVVPGIDDLDAPVSRELIDALCGAFQRGARLMSVCTGAFVLAAAGLLDGRRATTHWRATAALAQRYPAIDVQPGVLYVDEGPILTSAGGSAVLDICLHVIQLDLGAAHACAAATLAAAPLQRAGTQPQVVVQALPANEGSSLAPLLDWLHEHLHLELTIEQIARRAGTSVRSLNRRFREQIGTTPLQWLIRARIHRAQRLLETTTLSVQEIAEHSGFGTAVSFREHFRRTTGVNPNAYRRGWKERASAPMSHLGV
jgi:transcriptional regulator GlxA family with amidase domain